LGLGLGLVDGVEKISTSFFSPGVENISIPEIFAIFGVPLVDTAGLLGSALLEKKSVSVIAGFIVVGPGEKISISAIFGIFARGFVCAAGGLDVKSTSDILGIEVLDGVDGVKISTDSIDVVLAGVEVWVAVGVGFELKMSTSAWSFKERRD